MSNQGWHAIRPRIGALTASAFSPPAEGGGGTVTAPAATSEALPDTDTPTAKTFSAFTDTEGLIDNYASTILDIVGTTTASGSGLGPYTYSGAGPGTAFVHLLTARDASNNPLATAAHGVDIMPEPPSAVTAPAATSESVASGGSPSNKTFSAFTDPDGLIDNYVSAVTNISGTTTATGTGLGAYSYSGATGGTAFVHTLTARDADNNPLATAVHGVRVAENTPAGPYDWVSPVSFDFAAATTAGPWTSGTNAVTGAAASSVNVVTLRSGTTNGQVEVTADGLETAATTGTGNINSTVDLQAYLSANDAYFTDYVGVVVVQACYKLAALAGTGAYWVLGVSNKTQQGQAFCGVAGNYSAGNVVVTTYYDLVSNTTLYSGAIPTDFRVTVWIYQGRTSRVKFEAGVSTIETDPPTSGLQFTGQPVLASSAAQFFGDTGGADFGWLTSIRSNGSTAEATLTGLKVWRLEVVP